ncbi:MAG: hypothetical protein HQK51_19280, partial [Oligoflexia bacterium]|nr:hypothetical protein [Oligoflexia bacterium]
MKYKHIKRTLALVIVSLAISFISGLIINSSNLYAGVMSISDSRLNDI